MAVYDWIDVAWLLCGLVIFVAGLRMVLIAFDPDNVEKDYRGDKSTWK